jgi:hypothetical protein
MNVIVNLEVVLLCSLIPTLITLWLNEKVKGSVKNSFDKKLEEIKKEHSKEISQFQTELNYLKSKENFKFTKLHEKRLEVLQNVYEHLNQHIYLLKYSVSPIEVLNSEGKPVMDAEKLKKEYRTLHTLSYDYIKKNFIFFSKDMEEQLRDFFNLSARIYTNNELLSIMSPRIEASGIKIDYDSLDAKKIILESLVLLKKEIENKFRELLGE